MNADLLLHHGLQVGRRRHRMSQFYTGEVMEVNQAIDAGRRSMYDPC